ncbi:MAG: TnpV protein [Massilimicrobiota timonensis]
MKKIKYIQNNDYLIPNIRLKKENQIELNKWGRMRKTFLKEHKPMTYNDMILNETLIPHLMEVQETAQHKMELLMEQLLQKNPAPNKKVNQMAWVQHMNSLKSEAEEIVMTEIICC